MMDIQALANDKALKPLDKRARLIAALDQEAVNIGDLLAAPAPLNDRACKLQLEAIEESTRTQPERATPDWMAFAQQHLASPSPGIQREAARIAGNLAARFPDALEGAIPLLLAMAQAEGTVLRWAAAYALGRMVALPTYANGTLIEQVRLLAQQEENNGVKQQYLTGIKKAERGLR